MRYRSLFLLACLLLLRGPASAQKPPADPYADELKKLQQDFSNAQNAYYKPFSDAKTDEERGKVQLDPKLNPTPVFLPKFQTLAKKAHGTRSGAQALLMITNIADQSDAPAVRQAYRTLITEYSGMPEGQHAISGLRYGGYLIGEDESRKLLQEVIDGNSTKPMKAAAIFTLAAKNMDRAASGPQRAEARRLFDRLKGEFADSPYAKQADSAIFELEHLQKGMVAPDFEATDETGKKFKLSDYRGKVVVLDFWGFW